MDAAELGVATNGAIIHVLWSLLLITALCMVAEGYIIIQLYMRWQKALLFIERLENLVREMRNEREEANHRKSDTDEGIEALKTAVRRAEAIRGRTDDRLKVQNTELAMARDKIDVLTTENVLLHAHWEASKDR